MRTTENTEYPEDKYPYSEITDKIIKCADPEFFSDFSGYTYSNGEIR